MSYALVVKLLSRESSKRQVAGGTPAGGTIPIRYGLDGALEDCGRAIIDKLSCLR
jgi:hypothetical protein